MLDRFLIWKRFTEPGERILWCGREAVLFGQGRVPILVPTLIAYILYYSSTYNALMDSHEKMQSALIIAAFIYGGVFLLWLGAFRTNERYCITDRRVIIRKKGRNTEVQFGDIKSVGQGTELRTMMDSIRENEEFIRESLVSHGIEPSRLGEKIKLPELSGNVSGEPVKITCTTDSVVYINVFRPSKVRRILENAVKGD